MMSACFLYDLNSQASSIKNSNRHSSERFRGLVLNTQKLLNLIDFPGSLVPVFETLPTQSRTRINL